MRKWFALLLFGGCTCICQGSSPVAPPTDTGEEEGDAGVVDEDPTLCRAACEKMEELGCEEGKPVSTGERCHLDRDCTDGLVCVENACHDTCENFCNQQLDGGIAWNTSCLTLITSCEGIDMCVQE